MDGKHLFPVSDMEIIFDEIEKNSSSNFDKEDRNRIERSMSEKNRETIQSCGRYDINLILLKEIYKSQRMVEMLGSKSLSEDLKKASKRLENQIARNTNR